MTIESENGESSMEPEEAFGLLGNETRVSILQTLWDAFESGKEQDALAYSELFEAVDYDDSGNFSYHLEKLTGPFVRQTTDGYELKQTGINVIRAVVTGTVTGDPEFGPTAVDVACPICGGTVEVAYADEILTASCAACDGALRWHDEPGYLFLGLVSPALMDHRSVDGALRAAITNLFYQLAALRDGVCPHCSGVPTWTLEACHAHTPGPSSLCPNCDRFQLTKAVTVCRSCKWRAFPPAAVVMLTAPPVIAFYQNHGIEHPFAGWEGLARSFEVREELVSEAPLRVQFRFQADDDELSLTVDETMDVGVGT